LAKRRPAGRVRAKDLSGFAAAARVAQEAGWRYAMVTGLRPACASWMPGTEPWPRMNAVILA
jgi:hypothetical protein